MLLWSNVLFDIITKLKRYIQDEVQGLRKPLGHILPRTRYPLYAASNSNEQSIVAEIYFLNCLLLKSKLLNKGQGNNTISVQ